MGAIMSDDYPPPRPAVPPLLVAAVLAVVLVGGGILTAVLLLAGDPTSEPSPPTKVYEIGEAAEVGDVRVRVASVSLGSVGAKSPAGVQVYSQENVLAVRLIITNTDPRRTASVSGATGSTVKDDAGNVYEMVTVRTDLGFACTTDGAIDNEAVYSDKPVGDCLLFNRPVPAATVLHLSIDAGHYGGRGKLIFRIPRSAWTEPGMWRPKS